MRFAVTHYYLGFQYDDFKNQFCLKQAPGAGCSRPSSSAMHTYITSLRACMAKATELGMELLVAPRLEDGSGKGAGIRDTQLAIVDPVKTYADALINPLATIVAQVMRPGVRVMFCMAGGARLARAGAAGGAAPRAAQPTGHRVLHKHAVPLMGDAAAKLLPLLPLLLWRSCLRWLLPCAYERHLA